MSRRETLETTQISIKLEKTCWKKKDELRNVLVFFSIGNYVYGQSTDYFLKRRSQKQVVPFLIPALEYIFVSPTKCGINDLRGSGRRWRAVPPSSIRLAHSCLEEEKPHRENIRSNYSQEFEEVGGTNGSKSRQRSWDMAACEVTVIPRRDEQRRREALSRTGPFSSELLTHHVGAEKWHRPTARRLMIPCSPPPLKQSPCLIQQLSYLTGCFKCRWLWTLPPTSSPCCLRGGYHFSSRVLEVNSTSVSQGGRLSSTVLVNPGW